MVQNQKDIAADLDRARLNCPPLGNSPATQKQVWFLAKLIADAGEDASTIGCQISNRNAILTKGLASRYISDFLKRNQG